MRTKRLGNSDLEITPIGIGAWAMGGTGYAFSWGEQDDDDSIAAIRHGLDLGMNWIDTAAVYGLGHSEEVVARALKGRPDRPYVFTKCERVWDESGKVSPCLKRDSIRAECESSLRRLQTDVIDLYQIHWPDPEADVEEGWTALAELQSEGKIRHIGVSNFNVAQMKRAQSIAPITSLQPPYSAIRREVGDEILPFCLANDIGVIVYSPMGSGLLSGTMTRERIAGLAADDWRSRSPQFKEPALTTNLAIADKLGEIARRHGRSTAEAAIAWTLHNPAVTAAIVGLRSAAQADGVIGALEFRLTEAEAGEV
jgi:aryl-alcohol dehydrogenase-like predicted oxidoreductase